jgi:hypothetical protein
MHRGELPGPKLGDTSRRRYGGALRTGEWQTDLRTLVGNTNLTNRLNRLERRLGPTPAPMPHQVTVRAWVTAFSGEELTFIGGQVGGV